MIALQSVTTWGLSAIRRHVRDYGALPAEVSEGWFERHPSGTSVDAALAVANAVDVERVGSPGYDGDLAEALHSRWHLRRNVAAQHRVWPWLAVVPFARYTQARWTGRDGTIAVDRVGARLRHNAVARLWWAAEHTRLDNVAEVWRALGLRGSADDPYAFSRILLEPGIDASLGRRSLVRIRALAIALLAHLEAGSMTSEQFEQLLKSVGLAMSTITPEYFDCRVSGNAYHLDPAAVVELFETIEGVAGDRGWFEFRRP